MTTHTQTTHVTSLPLNKLVPAKDNVRKTDIRERIGEPKASITSQGVLQSLVVTKAARGKYAVVAGQRRFLALSELVEEGVIPPDYPVPCRAASGKTATTAPKSALPRTWCVPRCTRQTSSRPSVT